MKKLSILAAFCLTLFVIASVAFAEESIAYPETVQSKHNVAIIPYINSSEEKKGYVQEVIDQKYTEQYDNKNFNLIPLVEVQKALNTAGYDNSNMELPDKDVLASVARDTNAKYVIAMEISQLITTRHISFFQSKVVTKAKLRYKFYNAEKDKAIAFQTTGLSENKTVFGDVGYRDPITKALNQAMDEANEKIMNSL